MKNIALYAIPIKYMLLYVVLILVSGVWLFLLSEGLNSGESVMHTFKNIISVPEAKSIQGLVEVLTPHLFAMATLIFVAAHFMLFSTKVSQKVSLIVAMLLFVFALFDIFSYFFITFGWFVSGWIKILSMLAFVLLFVLMLGLLAFSL